MFKLQGQLGSFINTLNSVVDGGNGNTAGER